MSRLFGPIRQMGFVVRDLERAVQYWTQTLLGIGMRFVWLDAFLGSARHGIWHGDCGTTKCYDVGQHEPTNKEKEGHMKALSSVIVLGIGFLMVSGSPTRAQLGELGEAAKKGASEAVKQEVMKQAGLPTPGTPAVTPAATGAATAPAGEPKGTPGAAEKPAAAPGADTGAAPAAVGEPKVAPGAAEKPAAAPDADTGAAPAAVGEPKVAPGAAEAPAGAPGAAGTLQGAGEELMKKKMPKVP